MYQFITTEGTQAHIGENQTENDHLVRTAKQHWTWCHAEHVPSGHGILETSTPTRAELKEVAEELRKRCRMGQGRVEYCLMKYVRRTSTPGLVELTRRPRII